jgi:4'-phosphopantetheinyl transferase EntD
MERLLPAWVSVREARDDPSEAMSQLFDVERAYLARAVERRRREFATVRWCARRALGALGVAPVALPRGAYGAPVWPEGFVGSMTHCDGYRAAAVGRNAEVIALGIDAEPNEPLPPLVGRSVASEREWEMAAALRGVAGGRLLFSAKEAVYKAWYPWTSEHLTFTDIHLEAEMSERESEGRFWARLPDGVVLQGRWLVEDGVIVSAVCVER